MWLPFPPNRSLLGESLIYSQLHLAGSWWYYSTFRPAVMNANDDWGNTEGYLTWPKEEMIAGMVQIKKYWVSFMAAMLSVFEGHEMWQKVHYMKRALGWKGTYASHVFIFCTLLQWLCIIIYIKLGLGSETSLVGSPAEITILAIQTQTMILHPIIVSKMKLKCIKL